MVTAGACHPVTGMIEEFFLGGKILLILVDLSREFFGYLKQSEDSYSPAYPGRVVPLEIFMAQKFSMGALGG